MKSPRFDNLLKAAAIAAYLMSAAHTVTAQQAPPEQQQATPPPAAAQAPDESPTPPAATRTPPATTPAPQAPPGLQIYQQSPRCGTGEILEKGKCVAPKPSPKQQPGWVQQSLEEHHPPAKKPPGGVHIPHCKPGETVVGNHCVPQQAERR